MNNKAMARFSSIVAANMILGALLFVIGLIVIAVNLTGYYPDFKAVGNGVLMVYVGGGLVSIGIFASLLQITAASIVEGVVIALRNQFGNPDVQEGTIGAVLSNRAANKRAASLSPSSVKAPPAASGESNEVQYSKDPDAWAQYNLSWNNYATWTEMGKPNLMLWLAAGRPDFREWVKANQQ